MVTLTKDQIKKFVDDSSFEMYEGEVKKYPTSFRHWWRYIKAAGTQDPSFLYTVYERALVYLPGSYKLWHNYLLERVSHVKDYCITDPVYNEVNIIFENSLTFMNKYPTIWKEYCEFLMLQKKITKTRRTFDRALQALPITQHSKLWPAYLKFARECDVWETTMRIYKRYILLEPSFREEYVDYLLSIEQYDEAAVQMSICCNDPSFVSSKQTTTYGLWLNLAELLTKHPKDIKSVKIEPILRNGLKRFQEDTGKLWCYLATYFIKIGNFERARDIYEEGIKSVMSVHDFCLIFDSYRKFEMQYLETVINNMAEEEEEPDDDDEEEEEKELRELDDDEVDVDLLERRVTVLLDQQTLLISSVRLRQNPNDVSLWLKRAEIFKAMGKEKIPAVLSTYREATKTIDPTKAIGKLSDVWIALAKYYEQFNDVTQAVKVYKASMDVPYKSVDELANIYCECVELYLRHDLYDDALLLLQQAVEPPKKERMTAAARQESGHHNISTRDRLHKNQRIWNMYIDLEESLGTVDSTRCVYNNLISMKLATPQNILNYGAFLQEHQLYEESFKIYEQGTSLFPYPNNKEIYTVYLKQFIERYEGKKVERTREIFEQCIEATPADAVRDIYISFSKFEEQYGLVKHMMALLDRCLTTIPAEQKYDFILYYISKAEEYYGITKTREIYERGLELLPDDKVKDLGLRFADVEKKLGEVDRARAIYTYIAQFCNPKTVLSFWSTWKEFEMTYGNKDTYREMLRLERSIRAQYDQIEVLPTDFFDNTNNSGVAPVTDGSVLPGFTKAVTENGQFGLMNSATDSISELEQKAQKRLGEEKDDDIEETRKRMKQDPSILDTLGKDEMAVDINFDGVSSEHNMDKEM
ncbi:hypothetical protein WA158_004056 [Blastocystis sp. Blastoise]